VTALASPAAAATTSATTTATCNGGAQLVEHRSAASLSIPTVVFFDASDLHLSHLSLLYGRNPISK
jgi:hypothetical protein